MGITLNKDYPVWGIDLSHWSEEWDFQKFKQAGGSFVILKALNGKQMDRYFELNYKKAKDAGVLVSSYQWILPAEQQSPAGQGRAYDTLLRMYPSDFAVGFIDYEGEKGSATTNDFIALVDTFESIHGKKIGVYSSWGKLNNGLYAIPNRFSDRDLWIADYSSQYPRIPRPFKEWKFWQFSEKGDGIAFGSSMGGEKDVDMNYFNGSKEDFTLYCSGGNGQLQPSSEDKYKLIPTPIIKFGDVGEKVKQLQTILVSKGFMTQDEMNTGAGYFGNKTQRALESLQAKFGLSSKIYDENTRNKIIEAYYSGGSISVIPPIENTNLTQGDGTLKNPNIEEKKSLFNGNAIYTRYSIDVPRSVKIHMITVFLEKAEIYIDPKVNVVGTHTFLQKNNMDIATNGDGFRTYKKGAFFVTEMTGYNASRGTTYGIQNNQSSLYISKNNVFSIKKQTPIYNAISFPNLLIENGQVVKINKSPDDVRARTAIGIPKVQDRIYLVVNDGKDYFSKEGLSFQEMAEFFMGIGVDTAVMLDGGGSSTMVVRDENDNLPNVVNIPSGENKVRIRNKDYMIRYVANHFGIKFRS